MAADHCRFDHVRKFTYIPWPVIVLKGFHGFLGNGLNRFSHSSGKFCYKPLDEQRDVFGPVFKGWNFYRIYIEPIPKILSKPSLFNFFLQITVRGSNNPHVSVYRFGASKTFKFTTFQNPQQLALKFHS